MKLTLFIYIAIKSYIFELKTFRNRFLIYLFLKTIDNTELYDDD